MLVDRDLQRVQAGDQPAGLERADGRAPSRRLGLGIERVDLVSQHVGDDLEPQRRSERRRAVGQDPVLRGGQRAHIVVDRCQPVGGRLQRGPEQVAAGSGEAEPGDRAGGVVVPDLASAPRRRTATSSGHDRPVQSRPQQQ